jgi:AcrR family transcriptional regulator
MKSSGPETRPRVPGEEDNARVTQDGGGDGAGQDGGGELPPSLEAAWGVRGRPPRGPRPALTLDRIVAAGVQIATTDGLAAVSMGRVAAELGTGAMSLYRYVASKDELLGLMADSVYGLPPPAEPGDDWRGQLSAWAVGIRDRYRQHPWVVGIPISGLPIRPNEVAWFEAALAALAGTGLTEDEKGSIAQLVGGYVRNAAMIDADIAAAVSASGQPPQVWLSSYAHTITRLADPHRFPALTRFVTSGVFEKFDPPDTEFHFGLDRLLDGIAVLIRSRT